MMVVPPQMAPLMGTDERNGEMARRKQVAPDKAPKYWEMDPDEVLETYPAAYLKCRMQHRWSEEPTWRLAGPNVLERQVVCTRCSAIGYEEVDARTYRRISPQRKIRYPRGYLTPKTGLVRSDFRSTEYRLEFAQAEKHGRVFDSPNVVHFPNSNAG